MKTKRDQLTALLLTLLIAAVTCGVLVSVKVMPASALIPPAPEAESPELFFADIEYKEIVSDPTPEVDGVAASGAAAEVSGSDLADIGGSKEPESAQLVSAPASSTAKVAKAEPKEPDPGPTEEELRAIAAAKIRERMGKSTGLKSTDRNSGSGQATDGKAAAGNNPGADGLGLDGRKRLNKPDPGIKNATGTVKVKIQVNAAGTVTSATVVRSSGFGKREQEVRNACEAASRKLQYTPDPEKPSQTGTITWNIR